MMWVTSDSLTPCTTASLPRVAYRVTTVKNANVIMWLMNVVGVI